MKILHYYIITIFATSLVVVSNPVFADDSTSYGGFTGYRQAYFQGNHGSYPIWYKITNGTVVGTPLDLPAKALLFEINTTSNGQLTVDLPRTIIDSKNGSDDVPYFVSVYDIKSLGGPMKISPEEIDNEGVRTLKINFTKDITEIEIVGTFFVEKYHYAAPNSMSSLSPLKQYESGLAAKDVKCNSELWLVIKAEDGSPACVQQDTIEKLVGRGWAFPVEVQSQNKSNKISADIQQQPYTNITINGLKENYTLNEPIVFYIAIEGYGTGCGDAKAIITKENDSQYKSPVWGVGSSCASDTKQNHFKFNTLSVNTSINQTGNYILTASFDDFVTYPHTTEKKFSVITELR